MPKAKETHSLNIFKVIYNKEIEFQKYPVTSDQSHFNEQYLLDLLETGYDLAEQFANNTSDLRLSSYCYDVLSQGTTKSVQKSILLNNLLKPFITSISLTQWYPRPGKIFCCKL